MATALPTLCRPSLVQPLSIRGNVSPQCGLHPTGLPTNKTPFSLSSTLAERRRSLRAASSRRALLQLSHLAVVSSAVGRGDLRASSAVETTVQYEMSSFSVSVTQEASVPNPAVGPPAFATATGRIVASEWCSAFLNNNDWFSRCGASNYL